MGNPIQHAGQSVLDTANRAVDVGAQGAGQSLEKAGQRIEKVATQGVNAVVETVPKIIEAEYKPVVDLTKRAAILFNKTVLQPIGDYLAPRLHLDGHILPGLDPLFGKGGGNNQMATQAQAAASQAPAPSPTPLYQNFMAPQGAPLGPGQGGNGSGDPGAAPTLLNITKKSLLGY